MTRKKRKSKDEQPAENFEHQVQDAFEKLHAEMERDESGQERHDLTANAPTETHSVEETAGTSEPSAAENEAESSASGSEELIQSQDAKTSDEPSMDDLLDDVRRSLIEAEAQGEEKKSGWLSRIARGFQKDQPATESPVEEGVMPLIPDVPVEAPKNDPYVDEIDELIEMLEPKAEEPEAEPEPGDVAEVTSTPELEVPSVDTDDLQEPASSRPEDRIEEQTGDEVRAAALEGGEEVFVEVQAGRRAAGQGRLRSFEDTLRPYSQ